MSKSRPDAVLRPAADGWELWRFPQKGEPSCDPAPTAKSLSNCRHPLLAPPTRSILAVPLWTSPGGDPRELAELELGSRHLLRKGAMVYSIPLLENEGRALVLALAVSDDEISNEFAAKAISFEPLALLLDSSNADILVWREFGNLCFALYRDNLCVFFSATGESTPGPAFCGLLARTALRLRAEGVLARIPARIRLLGSFEPSDCEAVGHALRIDWDHVSEIPAPNIPERLSECAPATGNTEILKRARIKKASVAAAIILAVYAGILLVVAADLAAKKIELSGLASRIDTLAEQSSSAEKLVADWKAFRPAVDPGEFAIDQLAAVSGEIPGEQVRLTQYNLDNGRLVIAGEAVDVSQAYEFFERVKRNTLLGDFEWTTRQPQLAGRNKVRFEMEGAKPDAQAREE